MFIFTTQTSLYKLQKTILTFSKTSESFSNLPYQCKQPTWFAQLWKRTMLFVHSIVQIIKSIRLFGMLVVIQYCNMMVVMFILQ